MQYPQGCLTSVTPARLSSHISVEPSDSNSKQRRICATQSALLTNATVWSHIVVRESIAVPIDIRRVHQPGIVLFHGHIST
jgi:hypothetical protein